LDGFTIFEGLVARPAPGNGLGEARISRIPPVIMNKRTQNPLNHPESACFLADDGRKARRAKKFSTAAAEVNKLIA
jgi:hypothetical protein